MPEFGTTSMTLSRLVTLSQEFLDNVQHKLLGEGRMDELKMGLTDSEKERMMTLSHKLKEDARESQRIMTSSPDQFHLLDGFNASAQSISLQFHDTYLASARRIMGDHELSALAPADLRSATAIELLELNQARTTASLVKNKLG